MITERNFLKGLQPMIFPWEDRKVKNNKDSVVVYGNFGIAFNDIVSYSKAHNYHFEHKRENGLTYLKFYPVNEVNDCYQEFANCKHVGSYMCQFLQNINKGFVDIEKINAQTIQQLNKLKGKYPKVYIGVEQSEYQFFTRIVFYEKPKEEKCNQTTHTKVEVNKGEKPIGEKKEEGLTDEDVVDLLFGKIFDELFGE